MLGYDYTVSHTEDVKYIHLTLFNKYNIKISKKLGSFLGTEVVANEHAEIQVDTRIKTGIKIQHKTTD